MYYINSFPINDETMLKGEGKIILGHFQKAKSCKAGRLEQIVGKSISKFLEGGVYLEPSFYVYKPSTHILFFYYSYLFCIIIVIFILCP